MNSIPKVSNNIFSFKGRIGRLDYLLVCILLILISSVYEVFNEANKGSIPSEILTAITFLITLFLGWIALTAIIKRMRDLNLILFWLILIAVPYVNFLFGLYLLFGKSKANTLEIENLKARLGQLRDTERRAFEDRFWDRWYAWDDDELAYWRAKVKESKS